MISLIHIRSDFQDGRHSVCAAAGPGEEPNAVERSGLQSSRVQDQLPCLGQHPSQRGRRWYLHWVRKRGTTH